MTDVVGTAWKSPGGYRLHHQHGKRDVAVERVSADEEIGVIDNLMLSSLTLTTMSASSLRMRCWRIVDLKAIFSSEEDGRSMERMLGVTQ